MGQLMTVMTRYWPQEEARASTPSDIVQEEDVDGDQGKNKKNKEFAKGEKTKLRSRWHRIPK